MNEEQLQELLSIYRYRRPMPALRSSRWWLAPIAAAVLIAIAGVWASSWHAGWRPLRAGDTIAAATRIRRTGIGYVDIAAGSVVRFEGGNRLSLERGSIHAKTVSPPGIFIVDTPHASAVDLGCEYVLSIAADGSGVLIVTAGWVALNNWRQSLVPQGARASIDREGRLGPPGFDDAAAEFKNAIARGDLKSALAMVSITEVEVAPDLNLARVFLSGLNEMETKQIVKDLTSQQGRVRHFLGQRIHLRVTPELDFRHDDTSARAGRIEELLADIKK